MHDGKCDADYASTVTVSEILPAVPQAISPETVWKNCAICPG